MTLIGGWLVWVQAAWAAEPDRCREPAALAGEAVAELLPSLRQGMPANDRLRLAVQPPRAEEAPLTGRAAEDLVRAVAAGLGSAARAEALPLDFVARADLDAVARDLQTFAPESLARLRAAAGADLLLATRLQPGASGALASFSVLDLRPEGLGTAIAWTHQRCLALDSVAPRYAFDAVPPAAARAFLGRLEGDETVVRGGARLQRDGELTPLGAYLLDQLVGRLGEAIERRAASLDRPLAALGEAPPVRLALTADVWSFSAPAPRVEVVFRLLRGAGEEVALATFSVDPATIPTELRPPPASGGRVGGRFAAAGDAASGGDLDGPTALEEAARAQARARVIAAALGLQDIPGGGTVRRLAEVSRLQALLAQGVPHREAWSGPTWTPDGGVRMRLEAEVRPLGENGPSFRAEIEPLAVPHGGRLTLRLADAREPLRVGVFGWFAEGIVVRLYPDEDNPEIHLDPGQALVLPRPPIGWNAGLAPGRRGDQEVVLVLASRGSVDYDRLAPLAGDSVASSLAAAVPAGLFLEKLANLPEPIGLAILPYTIHR